jgi:ABC-type transport system involved in multi-copper enzyme maturation permease subunit
VSERPLPPRADDPARVTGAIHDLGYARYAGQRSAPTTRWRVIMRHQLAQGWKTWWRFKAALGLAVVTTFVAGGFLYLASDKLFKAIGRGGLALTFADGIVPMSVTWYCKIGFLASLTLGATAVASDVQRGAFTFYFARSVRPRDYVLGRLAGLTLLAAVIMLAGPLLLVALRLGLADPEDLGRMLPLVPRVLVVGVAGALTYAVVPFGFSALVANRRYALALWAAYYLVVGTIATHLGDVAGGALAALDLPTALTSLSNAVFDVHLLRGRAEVALPWAAASLAGHVAVALVVVSRQLVAAQRSGVGGSP